MYNLGYAELLIILLIFGIIVATLLFLAWYFVSRARAKDKQFLIEKGITTDDPVLKSTYHFSWLKIGIVIVGLSLSLFLLGILDRIVNIGSTFAFAIILLFAGLSMIAANYISKKSIGK